MPTNHAIGLKTFADLEQSLTALTTLYQSDPAAHAPIRAAVIKAKDRARFAANNPRAAPEKRAIKQEMLQWMLVWLDDPAMFPTWVALRKNSLP
jgi:hypothetical protein